MGKAIADPAELRRFAQDLRRFNAQVTEQARALQTRFANLGATWRDQEHQKFAEQFESTMRGLGRFVQAGEEHIPFLVRKAERIEEYLNQR